MEVKNKFNTVKIATCNDAHKAEAVSQLFERSLLFNRSDDICGIVISKNDEKQFIPISAIPDNVNIEKRDGVVTLVENPVVDSITTKADHNGVDWKSQHKIAETSAERTIILLCTKNIENVTNIGVIGGEILEVGEGVYGNYKISLTPTGSGLLIGATTFEQKAALVRAKYNGTYYYGIKFKSTVPANIYFSGWDHFPAGADAPLYTSYTDADLSEIIELGGGDSGGSSGGGMTEDEKVEINGKIDALQGQVASAIVSIDGIEQRLSDIFSAENKVTDFNTTINSGIYYWLEDATNKPANYGVLLVNKYDRGDNNSIWVNQVAYGTNNKIYFRQNINSGNWTEWKAVAFEGSLNATLTVNGKTYNGSSAVDAGVQTVANGGTGATDAATAFNTLADGVRDSSTPVDNEKMLLKPTGTWYKTTCLDFWNYIKDKIYSVLGLTKDNYGGTAATILDYNRNTPIKVRWGGSGIDSADWYPAFNADGSAIEPINRTNIHAGTADMARNMYYQNLDLSELDKTKFYPLVCYSANNFAEVAIHSESGMSSAEYNQNRIHFDISTQGWSDLPFTLNIREYACYQNNEITIGCIGRGIHNGAWAIWLRGGLHYTCFSRDSDLSLHTSDYTFGDEVYTVGTNYYGGSNTNVNVVFTPQSTITEGAYSNRVLTAPAIKTTNRLTIPIGAPSSLEDGCIWIER